MGVPAGHEPLNQNKEGDKKITACWWRLQLVVVNHHLPPLLHAEHAADAQLRPKPHHTANPSTASQPCRCSLGMLPPYRTTTVPSCSVPEVVRIINGKGNAL
jgi:hypothetical protein